jgi:DNA polymerase I-like protein with 3'-5' exonuclease and polymerase domains
VSSTLVGGVELPDLPPGTPVAFDTETCGLYVDGDPSGETGDSGAPPARVSAASIAYRDPETGVLVKHAWGFDQGPHPDKQGRALRPSEGGGFETLDVDKMLLNLAKAKFNRGTKPRISPKTGRELKTRDPIPYTWQECYEAIGLQHWVNLLKWLRDRDLIVNQNLKFDMLTTHAGMREELVRREIDSNPSVWDAFRPGAASLVLSHLRHGKTAAQFFACDLDYLSDGATLRPVRGFWDTMLVQAMFEPLKSVALKPTAKRLFGVDADQAQQDLKAAMSKQGKGLTKRYDLVPWFIMEPYAADDAELALLVYEYQQQCIAEGDHPENLDYHLDLEFELMRTLYRMERRGVPYDVTGSRRGADRLRARMAEVRKTLPFDPSKTDEAKAYYFGPKPDGLALAPLKVTEVRKDPCLDESQLRVWMEQSVPPPHVEAYDEWSHCNSALGKWYRGWAERTGPDGKLRCVFRQCAQDEGKAGGRGGGTISGRLAVSRVQLQAIPHNNQLPKQVEDLPIRALIGDEDDFELWEMDLPQGEVRIATAIANCSGMWDAIERGDDLHGANAKRVWDVDEEDPRYEELRGVGKRITFGTLYGAGVTTLAKQILEFTGIEYSESQTRAAKDAFDRAFPEFQRASRIATRHADIAGGGRGYVKMLDGRRRWFSPDEFAHKAFNQVIQGNLAQTGKLWMNEVERKLRGTPAQLVLAIHDSLVVRAPKGEQGRALAQLAADIGTEIHERTYSLHGRHMPFQIDIKQWTKKG